MRILDLQKMPESEAIQVTVAALQSGGLVVYPTETTYGIGADVTNQSAIDKLLAYKTKRDGKPLSIAVVDQDMAEQYAELNETAKRVYQQFLPGPVTVVSTAKGSMAKGVVSALNTIGVRISSYPSVKKIVSSFGRPITATGANASYKKRPYSVQDILEHLTEKQKNMIDVVLDAGELPHNEPSTVIDTTLDNIEVLRQGSVSFADNKQFETHSDKETQDLGRKIVSKYKNLLTYTSVVFCLVGEMGAGKTQFCKGIAEGLGIKETVSSPTFTLSINYPFEAEGKASEFVHIDTWRMFDDAEFLNIGFPDMIHKRSVIAVEWADRVTNALRQFEDEAKLVWVRFKYGKTENDRVITISDETI